MLNDLAKALKALDGKKKCLRSSRFARLVRVLTVPVSMGVFTCVWKPYRTFPHNLFFPLAYLRCWIAWVGCVPIWKSNKWWNSFLTCPKCISSFSSTHEFCFSLCILSKHMLKGSKARPKSQSWTLPTDTNWIDWDWDEFPGETSYQKSFLFVECNLKASPEVKVSEVTCWYELCGKLC